MIPCNRIELPSSFFVLGTIWFENRYPPRTKSGAGLFGIMPQKTRPHSGIPLPSQYESNYRRGSGCSSRGKVVPVSYATALPSGILRSFPNTSESGAVATRNLRLPAPRNEPHRLA
jgi:hypothetical protein